MSDKPKPQSVTPRFSDRALAHRRFQNKAAYKFDAHNPAEVLLSRKMVDAAKAHFKDHPCAEDL